MSLHRVLGLALTVLVGCSGGTKASGSHCEDNDECAPGEVCLASACAALCLADDDCRGGQICTQGVCATGSRTAPPQIASINGDHSSICPDAGGTNCVANGIVVVGQYLSGASFALVREGVPAIRLTPQTGATDTSVILGNFDAPPGVYLLTATNAAGSHELSVTLLQGMPGSPDTGDDIIAKINGTSGTPINASRVGPIDAAQLTGVVPPATLSGVLPASPNLIKPWRMLDADNDDVPDGWTYHSPASDLAEAEGVSYQLFEFGDQANGGLYDADPSAESTVHYATYNVLRTTYIRNSSGTANGTYWGPWVDQVTYIHPPAVPSATSATDLGGASLADLGDLSALPTGDVTCSAWIRIVSAGATPQTEYVGCGIFWNWCTMSTVGDGVWRHLSCSQSAPGGGGVSIRFFLHEANAGDTMDLALPKLEYGVVRDPKWAPHISEYQ